MWFSSMFKNALKFVGSKRKIQLFFTVRRSLIKRPAPFIESNLPEYEYPSKKASENTVYVWGLGEHGALGHFLQKRKLMANVRDPRFRTYNRPLRLVFGEYKKVINVAAGFGFSAFVVKDDSHHKVYGTGINTDSQLGYQRTTRHVAMDLLHTPLPIRIQFSDPMHTKVIGISAGRAHLAVCTDVEGVFLLGNNAYGQCGRTIFQDESYTGSRIVHNVKDLDGVKIKEVECGQDHTLFLTENGEVYSCGWGADGQTGLGHYENQSLPKKVFGDIAGENIVKISSKCDCTLAINDRGEVFGWGNSEYCQIFQEHEGLQQINKPIHLKKCDGYGKIIDVASAGSYCMMLNEAGEVFTWGFGLLGRGPKASLSWQPELIPSILFGKNEFAQDIKVSAIYCGLNHSAAINNKGSVYIWGRNKGCCLGLGHDKDQFFPLRVALSATCRKLSMGVDHTLALCRPL